MGEESTPRKGAPQLEGRVVIKDARPLACGHGVLELEQRLRHVFSPGTSPPSRTYEPLRQPERVRLKEKRGKGGR